ncbi:MAG: pantoate--beta-alanine ligase [Chloroflexi bacterium]|nr:MAG: pantoate--beta-alanine ligase [Chloroflexota bacterium]RLT29060.1 MAG: pantoate--beta-alanine ligase [Chloroflexota bacterium]
MRTVTTRSELDDALAKLPRPVALVPTMGALHAGHATLFTTARRTAATVVVSIFVNPRQFGSAADVAQYPRTLAADQQIAEAAGAHLLFAPDVDEIYPPDEPIATINPGPLATRLEGASRPGHFTGVATIVSRLFDLVHPDQAYFGAKDAQQVRVIEWMTAQRSDRITIHRVATVRDRDDLALSSRNQMLSANGRVAAAKTIPVALSLIAEAYASGVTSVATLRTLAERVILAEPSVALDYLDFADSANLVPLAEDAHVGDAASGEVLVSLAAVVDGVRLIDAITLP